MTPRVRFLRMINVAFDGGVSLGVTDMDVKHMRIWLLAVWIMLAGWLSASAAEWQWSAEEDSADDGHRTAKARAFLWVPPDCERVRAVVFAQNNMIEPGILEHVEFRKALAKLGMAEILVTPFFDYWQVATNNNEANERFNKLLKTFATESGHGELATAPIIPLGHSASASMPWNFAAWNPERTLAILSIKGDAPQTTMTGNGRPNLDWGGRNIDGIPGVMVMAEYEWLEGRLAPAQKFRAKYPDAPIAMLALPGRGHFDFDDQVLIDYLTRFISKAAKARLSRENSMLNPVDPKAGWLVDRWRKDEKAHARPAKFARYEGDQSEAFWVFDREMARLTEKVNASQCCKEPQLLGFVQDDETIRQTDTHNQVALKFLPMSDGVTFELATTFLDAVDGGSKNCSRWTGLPAETPLGHAAGGGPIRLSCISGPVEQLDTNAFRLSFNRFSIPEDRRAGDIWLLAEHPGDARYKSAVQQALLKISLRLTEGVAQQITFPDIPDVKRGTKSVKLNATADSGEEVHYYVREGPADIDGDTVRFTEIPPHAKYPVKVTVVAWQYGRGLEPKLKSAEPVERTFFIAE